MTIDRVQPSGHGLGWTKWNLGFDAELFRDSLVLRFTPFQPAFHGFDLAKSF